MPEQYKGHAIRGPGFVLDAPTSYGAMCEEREAFFNRHNLGRKKKTIKEARAEGHAAGYKAGLLAGLREARSLACAGFLNLIEHYGITESISFRPGPVIEAAEVDRLIAHVNRTGELPEESHVGD